MVNTQFWWFFDVLTVAVIIGFVYASARKGLSKSFVITIGCIFSVVIGVLISGSTAKFVYDSSVRVSNRNEIERRLDEFSFSEKLSAYLDGLDYNLKTKPEKIDEILKSKNGITSELYAYANNVNGIRVDTYDGFKANINLGYARIMSEQLKNDIPDYAVSEIFKKSEKSSNVNDAMNIVANSDVKTVSKYIEETYVEEITTKVIRIATFLLFFIIFMIVARLMSQGIGDKGIIGLTGTANCIAGGIVGCIRVMFVMFVICSAITFCIIAGNNKMMCFNKETIDSTIIFKYIYNLKVYSIDWA